MNMDLSQPKNKKKSASSLTVKTFEFKIEKPTSSLSRPLIAGVQCPDGKYRSTNPPAPVQGQPLASSTAASTSALASLSSRFSCSDANPQSSIYLCSPRMGFLGTAHALDFFAGSVCSSGVGYAT